MVSYDLRPVTCTEEELLALCGLLNATFRDDEPFTPGFLRWQYLENPAGRVLGFNAFASPGPGAPDELVAHYVAIPIRARVFGAEVQGLLSLNTVTHAAHQGQGLLTRLGALTYAQAQEQGKAFAVGVANQNSVHGMTRKLGFQSVGLLETRFGAAPRFRATAAEPSYSRVWDEATVRWRLANPRRGYFAKVAGAEAFIYGRSKNYPALVGRVPVASLPAGIALPPRSLVPFRLWLGRDAGLAFGASVRVPERARAVPLHFIFRDLTSAGVTLRVEDVRFWALDFDAY